MHGKLSGPAGRAPGAAGEWEVPETETRRSRSRGEQRKQKLNWALRGDEERVSGGWRTRIGRIKRMQGSLQEASGAPGWAGPGHPHRDGHLQPPGEIESEPRVRPAVAGARLLTQAVSSLPPPRVGHRSSWSSAQGTTWPSPPPQAPGERRPRLRGPGPRTWRRHRGSEH